MKNKKSKVAPSYPLKISLISIGMIISFQDLALANSSPYVFGGACGSQGVWTQSALEGARNLKKITEQLRDDPNCKGLGASTVASIEKLQGSVTTVSDSTTRATRLAQIPNELEALRTFPDNGNEDLKKEVLKLMMNRSIEQATLSAQVASDQASFAVPGLTPGDFGDRIRRGTHAGIQIMTGGFDGY